MVTVHVNLHRFALLIRVHRIGLSGSYRLDLAIKIDGARSCGNTRQNEVIVLYVELYNTVRASY